MAYTAQEPLDEVKALLNNPSGSMYPDARLIPLLQKAYRELQTKMTLNGLPVLKEASAAQTVNAGTIALGDGSGLPTDLVYPIELSEKTVGSTELWQDMEETDWEPDAPQGVRLQCWNWREEEIKFLGSTQNRSVRIRYMRGLTRITAANIPIGIINATTFLAARCAALAALLLGNNPTRAQALNSDAGMALDALIGTLVKREQGLGVRRRVNRYRR